MFWSCWKSSGKLFLPAKFSQNIRTLDIFQPRNNLYSSGFITQNKINSLIPLKLRTLFLNLQEAVYCRNFISAFLMIQYCLLLTLFCLFFFEFEGSLALNNHFCPINCHSWCHTLKFPLLDVFISRNWINKICFSFHFTISLRLTIWFQFRNIFTFSKTVKSDLSPHVQYTRYILTIH